MTKLARKRCEKKLRQLAIIFYITFLPIKIHTSFGKSKFTKKLVKYQNHIIYYVSRRRSLKGSLSCFCEAPFRYSHTAQRAQHLDRDAAEIYTVGSDSTAGFRSSYRFFLPSPLLFKQGNFLSEEE